MQVRAYNVVVAVVGARQCAGPVVLSGLKWLVRPVSKRTFGVSTHLYHSQRLNRDHLIEIAAHGCGAGEGIPNALSRAGSLVHFVEEDLDGAAGVCLDFGHAHMDGDLLDAIETVSGHLIATHVHDNRGKADDHLVPFDGTIDWAAALTAVQKVGYDGTLLFELAAHGSPKETLVRARKARERMETLLA